MRGGFTLPRFEGKVGQALILPNSKKQLTIVVGIGESAKATADVLRTAAAALARASAKVASLSTNLAVSGRGDRVANAQAVTEGLILATHRYDALKSDKKATSKLESVTLVAPGASNAAVVKGSKRGETIADAVCLARD
ncbi:MAG: M17 family peptidase N-terminal domain-containing protein, partial [Actinomycetota bacterium]